MVAIRNDGVGLEGKPAHQQAAAHGRWQEGNMSIKKAGIIRVVPTGTGIDHEPTVGRHGIRRWKCRKMPGCAKRPAIAVHQGQAIGRGWLQSRYVELPEIAACDILPATHANAAHMQLRDGLKCAIK